MAEPRTLTLVIDDEGDGMLTGRVEELPGCFASGADLAELREAAAEAVRMYLADDAVRVDWRERTSVA
jgi:predicted RNase H-like HicB family nuclease